MTDRRECAVAFSAELNTMLNLTPPSDSGKLLLRADTIFTGRSTTLAAATRATCSQVGPLQQKEPPTKFCITRTRFSGIPNHAANVFRTPMTQVDGSYTVSFS